MTVSHAISDREALERFKETHPEDGPIAKITAMTEDEFVRMYAGTLSGGAREARLIYRTAANIQEQAALLWANIKDAVAPHFNQTLFNNLPAEFVEQQQSIPGYDRLFGSLDFIECDHCRSIFGPAAYFVDLMRFVETHIRANNPEIPPTCDLFDYRRPDLRAIQLDCNNSTDLIPYIDLVTELLETFIKTTENADKDAYAVVEAAIFPMHLPFNLPLEQIRSYLKQLKTSLHQIYQTFARPPQLPAGQIDQATASRLTREFLELSPHEFSLIVSEISDPGDLSRYYGDLPLTGQGGLENVDVFLEATRLTRKELNELLFQDLDRHEVNAGLSRLFFINNVDDGLGYLAIVDGAGDPRAGYDRLLNLSPKKLDRIYRFLKLARKLGWSFADLDWSLRSLDQPYLPEKALKFDGVNDYVYVACARAPDPATSPTRLDLSNFTIEAWVNPSRAGRNVILSKGDAASGALHFLLWINSSNQLAFYAGQAAGASVAVESVYTIPVGVFTHVAVVADDDIARNGQRAVRLYINGRPDNGIALQSQIAPTGADLNIGRGLYGATAQPDPGALQGVDPEVLRGRYDECFEGIIKEVRVWSSARSQAAIEAGRYQRFTGREIDLAGYWPLTETLGDRLLDLTPNANHGVRGGAQFSPQPAWVRRDLILDPLPAPADGGGLRFNGVDQYLAAYADSAVAPDPANPAQLTVEAWVSIDELRENYIICEGDQESFSDPQPQQRLRFALWIDPSGQLVFQSGSPAQLLRSKRTIGTQTLAHVCVTLDGMSCAMYIDGLLDEAGGGNLAAPLAPPEVDLNVGRSFDGKYFKGLIREVRVWDQARAAEQIAASMYRPIPAGEPGLSGYWRLDTAADGRVADRSSGRRDLYLGGIPEDYMPDRLAGDQILPPTIAVPGMVLQFEGESGVVVIRNANNWGLGKYERLTLELWFRVTDRLTDRKQVIFTQGDSEAGLNIYLAANQVHVLTWNNSYEGDAFQSAMFTSDPISYGAWYHIAVTNNEFPAPAAPADRPLPVGHVELKAYLNGAALKTADGATAAEGFRLSPVGPAYLGGLDKSGVTRFADDYSRPESAQLYFFAGEITDIRLWNVVKTADEIERERIVAPTISDNLVAYFPTDEGGGWLVDDHAGGRLGNPHKGTLKDLNIALTTRTSDSTYADVYSHYTGQGALNWKDYAYSGRMRVDTASAAIGVTFLSRQPDGVDQYYRLGRDAQRPSFHLAAHPQGVQTIKSADSSLDKTDSGVVPQPETWYRFLIAVEDAGTRTNIRAKIWKDEGTGSEPADFQIDAYDDNADIRITSGTVGVWSAGASAGLRQFDTLRVWPAAIADPTSADLLLDINFEALSQVPEPELWQDTGDRTAAGAGARLFGPIGGSAGAAFGTLSTLDNIHAHYTPADPRVNARGWKDYSYEGRMRIGDLGGGIGVTFLSQYPDVDQYYRLGRDPQHPSFRLAAHPQGVQTIKSAAAGQDRTDSGIEPLPDTWYRFLIKVEDTGARTNIKAKVWPEGDSEPDFQIDAYDDYNFSAAPGERPVRLTSGTVGVWASGAGAKSFDTMRVLNGVLLAENFDAYATNQNPAGWRDTQKDSSYEEDDGLFRIFDVDHNSAFGTDRRNESIHSHYTAPDVLSWTNYLYRGRLRSSLIQGERADKIGIGLTFFSRYPEGPDPRDEHRYDRYYRLRRTPDDRNFVLAPHPDKRQFDGVTALTPALVDFAPDIWYRFLIKVEDTGAATRIRAKVWRDDGLEPSQFQLDAADKQNTADRDRPIRLTSGTVGLWAGYKGACYFDDLQVAHVALLSEDYAAADWTETAARSPRVVDDSLFEAIDAQDHTIRWVTVGDFPLLLRPLSRAALGFDGRRTYLAGPAHGAPDLSQLTIEAWINLAGSQEHPILSMGGSDPASPPAWFGAVVAADGSQSLAFHTGSAQDLARPVDPANPIQIGRPGAFTYVAASLSGDKVTYFVDGAPLGDLPLAPALALKLGRLEIGRDMGARYFGGQIKEVRLWKTARTAAQITATAERYQRPAPADDLIGYWAFDEADGETARDSSGQQNDLRLGGLPGARWPAAATSAPDQGFWRPQRQVIRFGDVDSLVEYVDPGSRTERQRRTVEVWFQVEDKTISHRKQVIYQEGDDQRGLNLYVYDSWLYFGGYNLPAGESGWAGTWLRTDRIDSGVWHHAAIVLDGRAELRDESLIAYLDGKLADVGPGSQLWQHKNDLSLGGVGGAVRFHDGESNDGPGHFLDGRIMELRVWNTARTTAQIGEFWSRTLGAQRANLALWWDFDQAAAAQIGDASGNGHAAAIGANQLEQLRVSLEENPAYALHPAPLNAQILDGIARIKLLKERHGLSIDRLTALWYGIKHTGRDDGATLFDQIFNPKGVIADRWEPYIDRPIRWDKTGQGDQGTTRESDRQIRSRLMGAARVSAADLNAIVEHLSGKDEIIIDLDGAYLGRVYQLAQLARSVQLSVQDFFRLLALLGERSVDAAGDLVALSDRVEWMRQAGLAVADLERLTAKILADEEVAGIVAAAQAAIEAANAARAAAAAAAAAAADNQSDQAAARALQEATRLADVADLAAAGVPVDLQRTVAQAARFARDAAGWTQRAVDAAQDAAARDAAAAALNAADLAWGAATRALIAAEQAEHSFSAFYSEPGARTLARNLAGQAQGFLLNETAFKSDNVKAEHSPDIFAFLSGGTITQSDGTPIATGPTFIDANGAVTPQYDESADLHDLLAALAAKHALLPEALRVAVAPIQQGLGKAVADAAAAAAAAVQAAAKARTDSAKAKAAEDAKAAATQKKLDEVIRRLQDGQRFAAGGQPRPIVDASKLVIVDLDTLRQIDLKALFDAGTTPDKAVLAGIEQALESTRISQDDLRTRVHEVLRQARSALADAIMAGLTELFGIQPKQPGLIDAVVSHFQSDAHMDSVRFYAHMLAILDPAADIPRALAIYLAKLGKALAIATAFDLSAAEAQALLRTPGLLGIGDILQPTIANLESLLRFKELKTAFGDDAGRLVTLLQQTVDTEISRQILALTGWEGRQLARAQSYFGAALAYNRVEVLDRLKQCFDLARSLALEVDFLIQLASPDDLATARELGFYTEQAAALLKVLRARYTDEEWPKVLDPIRSQLAVQKRDALLALALLKLGPDFAGRKDPDILYEYFLLDMQVGSEVLTSRIVQATASVQLYVQRCLMNLERGVSPDTIPAQEWEWVKNYRVWEANRKVFLYPENYIEPELRAPKSPLFEELEQELMQNDINQESVVKAYTSYLDKFREVANLRIVGSYLHSDRAHNPDGDEVLYLIGRTKTDPWVYYYRTLVNGTQWTPWQKIELTINAEFVTPVFAFNKLFLFWIEFAKKTKSVDRRYDPAKDLDDIKAGRKILGPNNTVINVRTNTAEQENINVYDTVVKFSYYNFSKSWVQPQMYLDLKNELKEDEYILPLWQRVYAQRSLVSFDQTVLEVSQPTSLSKNIPATFNMKGLTWSWWVRLQNAIPGGSIDKIDRTLTLFTYGDAASGMASALVTSNPTRIAGAPDVAALKTARDTAESEMKKAKDEMDAAWSYYNRLTSGGGAPQKRKKAKAKEDYDKKKATYDQKKATYDQAKAAYDAALTRLQWESKNPVLRFSIGDQSASLDLAYGVWQHVAVTTSYQNNQYQVSFYLDGVLKGAPALLTASALVAGKSLAIGQADTAGVETAFKAQMAEFQLWNSVRSATVINAQKDQRQSGDPANLFYLRLNAPEPGATMSLIARSDLSLRPPIQQEIAKVLRVSASAFVPAFVPQFNTDQLTMSFWVKFVSHYPVLPGQIQSNVDAAHLNIDTYIEGLRKSLTLFTFGDGPTATVKSSLTRLSPDIRDLKRARDDAQTNLTSANTAVTLASGVVSTAAQDAMDHPDDQSKKDALAKARSDYAAAQEDQKNKQTAYDNANRAYTAALAAPQWESKSLTLQFALGKDQKQTAAIDLAYGSWQHVALTMTYAGSGYTLQWYLNGERQGQPVSLTAGRLDLGSLLSIGQPDVSAAGVETAFTAQMSEFELWDRARDAATIKAEMRRRPSNRQWGLLRLPLDAIPSLQILFMTVVSFGTIEDSDLIFELPLPPVVPVKERERVLIFYGNVIRSLRQNNEEDQSFDLSLLSPDGNVKSYDVDLSRSTLYLTSTTGLSLNDYATQQGSTTQLATKRLNATTLQSYIDIIRADPNHPFRNQLEAAVQVAPSADMQLIKKLTRLEASVADVNNQPGWYIVNTGDEQFLVKATAQALKTIEERLRFEYKPDPNRLEIEPQASGIYFDRDPAFEPGGASNPPFKFEFVRLSTVAVHQLSLRLFEGGLDELLSLESQRAEEVHFAEYDPNSALVVPPNYDATTQTIAAGIDFEGAYGLYYQEIFFHIPFLIANRLNANQNFADAQRWYHYIFNPTAREEGEGNAGDRYWRYLAFRNLGPETLVRMLSNPAALKEYHEDPFDPHAIARLRVHAYQKAIVMKYIDNLLDWGDYLFTQDSRESINEATMLYVLAFNLLGPRPKGKTVRRFEQIGTYDQVRAKYGDNGIPDFLADVVPAAPAANGSIGLSPHSNIITDFCVLENEKFVGYWDRVEDRLFKIRHSLNIEGIFRQLALFQPPIEPAALVAAVAGGRGIAGALADLSVPAPHYRYAFVLEKAKDMVSTVIDLGSALLAAIESRDAEQLELLQNKHEQALLKLTTAVKESELAEAEKHIEELEVSLQRATERKQFYADLITAGISAEEYTELTLKGVAQGIKVGAQIFKALEGVLGTVPDIEVGGAGAFGSPVAVTVVGGKQFKEGPKAAAEIAIIIAETLEKAGEMTGKIGEYKRRAHEWDHEKDEAERDVQEIEKQMQIAEILLDRAQKELALHEREIEQNREIAEFYQSKFANHELYGWMVSRLAGLYFQGYKVAYDMAKSAEKALQYELPSTQTYITPGHWDSLRKGLLAGESLMLELNRMEKSHLDQDSRFLEIEKTISMRKTFPAALALLLLNGECEFALGERLFDGDYPGHYFRVIKTMGISVRAAKIDPQATVDPYESIKASLVQLGNKTLLAPDIGAVKYLMSGEGEQPDAGTLRVNWRANQHIAISKTVAEDGTTEPDVGMFHLDFVFDNRYFPFEGTGAVSYWRLELPRDTNKSFFDTYSVSDVVVHLRYTAKAERGAFRKAVRDLLAAPPA